MERVQQCRSWDDDETSTSPFCMQILQVYFCGLFAGGVVGRGTEGLVARGRCGAAACLVLSVE